MKLIIVLIAGAIIILALLSCSRDLTNPLEADSDLNHQPKITSIQFSNNQLVLSLDWSYSNEAVLLFERKSEEAFEPIAVQKLTASTFADNTLNLEQSYNLVYRFKVKKGDYQTEYSAEKSINYNSTLIFAPTEFSATTIELQGVRLNWQDNSSVETGYKLEKSENGSAYTELASLASNTSTYLHSIPGMPASPIALAYRIRAFNNTLNSDWVENNATYSGLGAPTNLVITDSTAYHFTIAWTRNSTIATGYEIERKKDSENFVLIQTVGATTQTYTDQLTEIGTYSYKVRAKKDNLFSSYSNAISYQITSIISIPTEGLIAYYPFYGNANDESGNGNNGTPTGASLGSDRFGNNNRAYHFTNSYEGEATQWIDCGYFDFANQSFSFSVWSYEEGNCRGEFLIGHNFDISGDCINKHLHIGYHWTSTPFLMGFWANDLFVNASYVSDMGWHHWVCSFDVSNRQRKIYRDSLLMANDTSESNYLGTGDIYIGKIWDIGSGFNGTIDDVCIYNHALTPTEIQALYHEGGWTGKQ